MIIRTVSHLKILALDTAMRRGSIALLEGRHTVAQLGLASTETHSARLLRSIEFLLVGLSWKLEDLNLIAAGLGPGSFTGIRIGVSTAIGLAQSLSIPFAGVSGLDALARTASWVEGRLGVMMDAQRSQIYYSEYCVRNGSLKQVLKPGLWIPAELRAKLNHRGLHIIGDGIERYRGLVGASHRWPRKIESDLYIAASIAHIAAERKRCWKAGEYLRAEPLYIRPPDAMRHREGKR